MKKNNKKFKKNKISRILDKIRNLSKITSENESEKQSESECISKSKFDSIKPPYSDKDILILSECAAAIEYPEPEPGQPKKDHRMSKYDSEKNLRYVFYPNGVVKVFAHFDKKIGLKSTLLGNFETMTVAEAARLSAIILDNQLYGQTLGEVAELYIEELKQEQKSDRRSFSDGTIRTYSCYLRKFSTIIGVDKRFIDITSDDIQLAFTKLKSDLTREYVETIFHRVKDLFKFSIDRLNYKNNPFNNVKSLYLSKKRCEIRKYEGYTDNESTAKLLIALEHNENRNLVNALKLCIFAALRPQCACTLKSSYLDNLDDPKVLIIPGSTTTERGPTKNQQEQKIILTSEMIKAIKDQLAYSKRVYGEIKEYLFVSIRNPENHLPYNTLREFMLKNAPKNMDKANPYKINKKGSKGSCLTMFRKLAKTNVLVALTNNYSTLTKAEIESKEILHHISNSEKKLSTEEKNESEANRMLHILHTNHDRSGWHYTSAEEQQGTYSKVSNNLFIMHENAILEAMNKIKKSNEEYQTI